MAGSTDGRSSRDEAPADRESASAGARGGSEGRETILLVEDEPQLRRVTRRVLERYGYTVREAESPEQALAVAAAHTGVINLLLTDFVMPGGTGGELAERMLRERPQLRVLLMSGYPDDVIAREGALPPGTAFLQKPCTTGELLRKVRAVLDG